MAFITLKKRKIRDNVFIKSGDKNCLSCKYYKGFYCALFFKKFEDRFIDKRLEDCLSLENKE